MKLLIILFLLFPGTILAQQVVINEIAWMGTPVDSVAENQWWRYEWLELFNAGEVPVSLAGWSIELRRKNLDFAIPLTGGISAKGYFLIVSSGKIGQSDYNYANLGGKFFNGGQQVLLKNAAGVVQDEVDARGGWFAGENETKETMERIDPLAAGSDPANWKTSEVLGGSPRAENSKKPVPLPQKKTDSSFRSAPLAPLHFMIAVVVALVSALLAAVLRRFLLRQASNSFGDLER